MTHIESSGASWKEFARNVLSVAGTADSLWAKFHEGKKPSGPPSMDDCIKISAREGVAFLEERSLIEMLLLTCWNEATAWALNVTKTEDRG